MPHDPADAFVPYDESDLWRIHDRYFTDGGAEVANGEVPHVATCNTAIARQHARLVATVAGDGPIVVLEVGAGSGRGAAAFLRALDRERPELARRTRYVLSDYSDAMLRHAADDAELAPRVARGQLLLANLDLRAPERGRLVDGQPLPGPVTAILASYVCCVLPPKLLAFDGTGLTERYVRVRRPIQDGGAPEALGDVSVDETWRPVVDGPEALFGAGLHAELVGAMTAEGRARRITYPRIFLDAMVALAGALGPGGLVLVNDFTARGRATDDVEATTYGSSLNHPVDFAVLERAGRALGWDVLRTRGATRVLQSLVFAPSGASGELRAAFERLYGDEAEGERLLELRAAIRAHLRLGEDERAVRLCRRAHTLDPDDAEIRFWHGLALLGAGRPAAAARVLRRAKGRLAPTLRAALELHLGRAYHYLGRLEAAMTRYRRSLRLRESALTHVYLAAALSDAGQPRRAHRAVRAALRLEPDHEIARGLIERIEAGWLARLRS